LVKRGHLEPLSLVPISFDTPNRRYSRFVYELAEGAYFLPPNAKKWSRRFIRLPAARPASLGRRARPKRGVADGEGCGTTPARAQGLVCDRKQEQPRRADQSYHQDGKPEMLHWGTGPQSIKHKIASRQPDPRLSSTSATAVLTDAATVLRASHRLRAREDGYTDGSGQYGKRQRRRMMTRFM